MLFLSALPSCPYTRLRLIGGKRGQHPAGEDSGQVGKGGICGRDQGIQDRPEKLCGKRADEGVSIAGQAEFPAVAVELPKFPLGPEIHAIDELAGLFADLRRGPEPPSR